MAPQERGFTLVELMVVLAVITIGPLIIAAFGYRQIDAYRFSNVVRTFNNNINLARIRAVQTQQTSRLVIRPRPDAEPTRWQVGASYTAGNLVSTGVASYTCRQAHTADAATNKPHEGSNWTNFWIFTIDFQYDDTLWDVEHCQGNPLVCKNASPYDPVSPVNIEFNTRGFTAGYIDHTFKILGAAGTNAGQPGTLFTISPLGTIRSGPTS
jgi:prepilin-type N-terminal cleavage/methylation domain-containing protein